MEFVESDLPEVPKVNKQLLEQPKEFPQTNGGSSMFNTYKEDYPQFEAPKKQATSNVE